MAEAAGAAVDQDRDLARAQAERPRRLAVVDLGDVLELGEVVARAQGAELAAAALEGPVADRVGVGRLQPPATNMNE